MKGALRIVLALVGLAAIMLGVAYFKVPAGSLPLPAALGFEAGSEVIHVKHGIVALLVGTVCWILAWDMGPSPR
jgi:hypothetical protein